MSFQSAMLDQQAFGDVQWSGGHQPHYFVKVLTQLPFGSTACRRRMGCAACPPAMLCAGSQIPAATVCAEPRWRSRALLAVSIRRQREPVAVEDFASGAKSGSMGDQDSRQVPTSAGSGSDPVCSGRADKLAMGVLYVVSSRWPRSLCTC